MFKKRIFATIFILLVTGCSPSDGASESTLIANQIATSVALTLGAPAAQQDTPIPEPAETMLPSAAPTGDAAMLTTDYENALPVEMQLTIGTLELDQTGLTIDPEQAASLLPLWQGLKNLVTADNDPDMITSQVTAIIQTMTVDQVSAIAAMQVTQDDVTRVSGALGLEMGPGGGNLTGRGTGEGQDQPPNENPGGRQGARDGAGGNMVPGSRINPQLLDAVIGSLETTIQYP